MIKSWELMRSYSNSKQRDKRRQTQVEPYKTPICNTFFFKGERASYDV